MISAPIMYEGGSHQAAAKICAKGLCKAHPKSRPDTTSAAAPPWTPLSSSDAPKNRLGPHINDLSSEAEGHGELTFGDRLISIGSWTYWRPLMFAVDLSPIVDGQVVDWTPVRIRRDMERK